MSADEPATALDAYARSIERLWTARLERPAILSNRDWTLIADWHRRQVPLAIVREAVDALFERRRAAPPRGLSDVAAAVDEGSAALRDGRLAGPQIPEPDPGPPAATAWRACRERLEGDSPLAGVLDELLRRAGSGGPASDLDAWLDERLLDTAPPDLLGWARRAADVRLEGFRGRMPANAWRATHRRAVTDRLRSKLGLPRSATR